MSTKPKKINPNLIPLRDEFMVKLIKGATKGGPHKNHKKETNKKLARKKITEENQ